MKIKFSQIATLFERYGKFERIKSIIGEDYEEAEVSLNDIPYKFRKQFHRSEGMGPTTAVLTIRNKNMVLKSEAMEYPIFLIEANLGEKHNFIHVEVGDHLLQITDCADTKMKARWCKTKEGESDLLNLMFFL